MLNTEEKSLCVDLELSSKPPDTDGFVPEKWGWVSERAFGTFSFFSLEDWIKIMKKQQKVRKRGSYGRIAKLF